MKNFKKVLALVLAIATLLSFATVASAKTTADFADAKDVKNTEAVDVLSNIKVLEGYPADNTFKPAKNITREEAAKIIAIFANKSTEISSLYTSANPFADMKGRWGESYVAYGYRAGIIAGKNATSFVPKANVKGTEFLKMVLVVLGFDQNKEGLVGSSWAVNTLELAKHKGLMNGLDNFDANAALTRDQAAQIMLNALKAEKVVYGQTITNLVWNAKLGYWTVGNTTTAAAAVYVSPNGAQNNYEHKLLAADFNLTLSDTTDKWGRPTHTWKKGTATIGEYLEAANATYYTAATECQIATDTAQADKEAVYDVYVNGQTAGKKIIQKLDTVSTIGAQGRETLVYDDRIVMIDTFLAKVTSVKDATYDAAGHLKTEATINFNVYDGHVVAIEDNAHKTALSLTNGSTNYTYAVDDYILVHTYTREQGLDSANTAENDVKKAYAEIVGKAESFEGAQTVIWRNANKHTVSGTVYDDAVMFYVDDAQNQVGNYTWFKDQYGNLIGSVKIATVYSYGVITKMYWNILEAGAGKVMADVTYMDGTTNTVQVASIKLADGEGNTFKPVADATSADVMGFANKAFNVSFSYASNAKADGNYKTIPATPDVIDGHLFAMKTLADGTVAFEKVTAEFTDVSLDVTFGQFGKVGNIVKADTETLFLVGTMDDNGAFTYKTYKGIEEVPTFTKVTPKIDYVTDAAGYAKYVYVIGEADSATTREFVYINRGDYRIVPKADDSNAIDYYEVTLSTLDADGKEIVVKTKDDAVVSKLTSAAAYGKLFYIKSVGGYVVADMCYEVTPATAGNASYTVKQIDGKNVHYRQFNKDDKNTYAMGYVASETYPVTFRNGVLDLGNNVTFKVTNATTVVGTLEAKMTDKVVYVIGNDKKDIAKVYVVDNTTVPSEDTTIATKGTVVYKMHLVDTNNNDLGTIELGTQVLTAGTYPATTASWVISGITTPDSITGFTPATNAEYQVTGVRSNDSQTVVVVAGTTTTVLFEGVRG